MSGIGLGQPLFMLAHKKNGERSGISCSIRPEHEIPYCRHTALWPAYRQGQGWVGTPPVTGPSNGLDSA